MSLAMASEIAWIFFFKVWAEEPVSRICGYLPALDGVRGGSGVSEVMAAFVASLATMRRTHDGPAVRLNRLLARGSLHRFRYPWRNSVRRERLVDPRNTRFPSPQARLEHLYTMTPFVFLAASTGTRCVSAYDFHCCPFKALWFVSRVFAEIKTAPD
jgi:hypothetical protein